MFARVTNYRNLLHYKHLIVRRIPTGVKASTDRVWVTRQLSGFVARELSAMFVSCSGGGDAADKHVVGGLRAAIRRGAGALSEAAADGGRGPASCWGCRVGISAG
jgi:hypothetical protein